MTAASTRFSRGKVVGAIAGLCSLAASLYVGSMQADADALMASDVAKLVPTPLAFVAAGITPTPVHAPLTASQRDRLTRALWRDPVDDRLFNLLYVDAVRRNGEGAQTASIARTLGQLGWRYTQAQQNLMMRAAVDGRYAEVVDRADALLRRQKLTDQAVTMLVAMETIPEVNHLVVAKLLGNPLWRHDFMMRIGPQSPPAVLQARLRTMRLLLASPEGVSRQQMTPYLQALVATGRGRVAYDLWTRKVGPVAGSNMIRDPDFRAAAAVSDETVLPFEWRMNHDLGFTADAGGRGATITWDGRGVPVFMTQMVPVTPGQRYVLTIEGRGDSGSALDLIAPALGCRQATIAFLPEGASDNRTRFRSPPVPAGCDIAELAIAGNVDAGRRAASLEITRIVLQRAP